MSEFEVLRDLNNLSSNKAPGPDGISNQIFKVFAPELAPVICAIYNQSLQESFVPESLKQSIVTLVPKISPPQEIENDLRPISLTNSIAKILEGFTNRRLLLQIGDKIDSKQFARRGHSTTHALVYLLQAIHEAIDRGNNCVRIFFSDFSKGFDLIDHQILMDELSLLGVDPVLFSWIRSFLTNRTQAVRIGNVLSDWKHTHGGIPQGTKMGVTLFSVMINRLLRDWNVRAKYVDDTTVVEILPRNSISLLDLAVRDTHSFCSDHKMRLNPLKCKEMLINFMEYPNTVIPPIYIGNHQLERVSCFKLLGVKIRDDLKWNDHIDYICCKAAKRLYTLRVLKRAGVANSNILNIYKCSVRSILEYAVAAWQDIPEYLSSKLEAIQRRALKVIFPGVGYKEALAKSGLPSLEVRRETLSRKFIATWNLRPQANVYNVPYNLRSGSVKSVHQEARTKRANDFITFRFLD